MKSVKTWPFPPNDPDGWQSYSQILPVNRWIQPKCCRRRWLNYSTIHAKLPWTSNGRHLPGPPFLPQLYTGATMEVSLLHHIIWLPGLRCRDNDSQSTMASFQAEARLLAAGHVVLVFEEPGQGRDNLEEMLWCRTKDFITCKRQSGEHNRKSEPPAVNSISLAATPHQSVFEWGEKGLKYLKMSSKEA